MIAGKTIFIAHKWNNVSIAQQSKELAYYFSKENKVIFFSSRKCGIPIQQINENLAVAEWPSKRPITFKDFFFALKMIRKYKPHLIISQFSANNIMMIAGRLSSVKIRISYYHTLIAQHLFDEGKLTFLQKFDIYRKGFAFRSATKMIASSEKGKEELIKYYSVKSSLIHLFPNAITDKNIKNSAGNIPVIAAINRLNYSKGIDILIEAVKETKDSFPSIHLIIIGKGNEEQNLKDLVKKLNLETNVSFLASVIYEKMYEFLATINFVVVPSRMDNLPTIVMDAFSCEIPVIGSNVGGIPSMIEDGYNGFLFSSQNPGELSEKMGRIFQSDLLREKLAKNARKTFEEKFNVASYGARFETALLQ